MNRQPRLVALILFLSTAAHADWRNVAPGVDYQEFSQGDQDVYVTRIDLTNDEIRVVSTRESDRGTKVSEFSRRQKAIAAINGDYFDDTFKTRGLAVGPCGQWAGTRDTTLEGFLAVGAHRASISRQSEIMDPPEEWIETAVSGWPALVANCEAIDPLPGSAVFTRASHPRTAVALGNEGRTLYLIVADGRRTGIPGLTLPQLATFIVAQLGACSAINFDGGGSAAMWVGDHIVNRPSDGVERPVSDHLAVVKRADYVACDPNQVRLTVSATAAKAKTDSSGVTAAPATPAPTIVTTTITTPLTTDTPAGASTAVSKTPKPAPPLP